MRVAHVITRMIVGGAQENTLHTCQDLRQIHGDDVLLITGPALGPEGNLLEKSRGGGGSVHLVDNLRRNIEPLRDYRAYQELLGILREFQPDVVHTHSAKAGLLGRQAAWKLGVPAVVHTVHGAPFHPYQSWVARRFFISCERHAARRCHHLISVADAMTDLLVEARVAPREKFTTIYSGMDVEPFRQANLHRETTRQSLQLAPEHVVIGKIARLFKLKGHDDLIQAARHVVDQNPEVRFLLVGDGILRSRFEQEIAAAGMTDHFRFTGLVAPERIPSLIGAMDVLVHTSLREGLARALPQGLISGKPVVSYDIDGAKEVVIPDVTGYLIPPRRTDLLGQALSRLARDATLRARLGGEGSRRFTERFRHEFMTAEIRKLYERLLQ
jgi:glycosyltransferase involved in cell wall biosynthesis